MRSFYRGSAYVERWAGINERVSDTQAALGGERTLRIEATARLNDTVRRAAPFVYRGGRAWWKFW